MLKKNKQWICKLIVLFIFMTGMCFEEIKADPVFVCTIIADNKDAVPGEMVQADNATSVYRESETERTEMLAARSTTNTQQILASVGSVRRTLKLSFALLYVTAVGLLLSNSNGMSYITWISECVSKTTVVNYIHNTDGKKKN